jgi:hypothetical protein
MKPSAGNLALSWKKDRAELACAFVEWLVFDNPLDQMTEKEPRRG